MVTVGGDSKLKFWNTQSWICLKEFTMPDSIGISLIKIDS